VLFAGARGSDQGLLALAPSARRDMQVPAMCLEAPLTGEGGREGTGGCGTVSPGVMGAAIGSTHCRFVSGTGYACVLRFSSNS